jgi:hypothetical protein
MCDTACVISFAIHAVQTVSYQSDDEEDDAPFNWSCVSFDTCYTNCVLSLTLSLLMLHICGVSKMFSEWYQKTNKTQDTNKLTLLAFKIIIILHNTRLATFIKLLETVSKGFFRKDDDKDDDDFEGQ